MKTILTTQLEQVSGGNNLDLISMGILGFIAGMAYGTYQECGPFKLVVTLPTDHPTPNFIAPTTMNKFIAPTTMNEAPMNKAAMNKAATNKYGLCYDCVD